MTDGIPVGDLTKEFRYENPAYFNSSIPWTSVIAFDSYLTDTRHDYRDDMYVSLYEWTGSNSIDQHIKFEERGTSNDFALSFGGNFSNLIYWGMTFECDYATYARNTTLQETFVDGSTYTLHNIYRFQSTGFTYKIGLIAKNNIRILDPFQKLLFACQRIANQLSVFFKHIRLHIGVKHSSCISYNDFHDITPKARGGSRPSPAVFMIGS
jgi:hypothetical protein